ALLDSHRLHDGDVHLAEEQVGEDQRVRRALEDSPRGDGGAVARLERRHVASHDVGRRGSEPLEGAVVGGRPVDLGVAVAPVARHALDALLVAGETVVLRADRLEERHVDEPEVIPVEIVLGQHLPVRRAAVLDPPGRELDFALRREIAGAVDQAGGDAEVLLERDARRPQAGEDEAAIAAHARGAAQALRLLVESAVIGRRVRHAEQLARQIVRPAVVGTREGPRVTARLAAHHRPPVGAAVDHHAHLAVHGPRHDHRLGPDGPRDEVARQRNLALVADEDPASEEEPVHLVGEDARVGVERGVHALVLDQRVVADGLRRRLRHSPHCTTACRSVTSRAMLHVTLLGDRGREAEMADYVLIEKAHGVAILTMNRPEQLNAMNHHLMTELHDGVMRACAYGGAAVLASSLDMRVGCEHASFRILAAAYGRINSTWTLPNQVGWPIAKELLFSARVVEAEEAQRIGLLNHLVPCDQLREKTMWLATMIAKNKRESVMGVKALLLEDMGRRLEEQW